MASDRQQFSRAISKWEQLQDDGAFSVPVEMGRVAIFSSGYNYKDSSSPEENLESFETEAYAIYQQAVDTGHKAVLIEKGTGEDLDIIMKDPTIASVVTIGHGALPYIYTAHGTWRRHRGNRYTWRDVSDAADHLKTGYFIQRQCGNAACELSVPLGTFAMSAHNNVYAAVNRDFNPTSLADEENEKIQPVTSLSRLNYEEVKLSYSYDDFLRYGSDGWD